MCGGAHKAAFRQIFHGRGPLSQAYSQTKSRTGSMRYIAAMFEVLVYVYENYWQGDACPAALQLGRKLTSAGFDQEEIEAALIWLEGLNTAAQTTQIYLPQPAVAEATIESTALIPSSNSLRVYSPAEQHHLGASALGFVSFLDTSGVLAPQMREIVIDRAMASADSPLALDDLKIIVLMVYWSFGQEPDALILDELCDDPHRIGH